MSSTSRSNSPTGREPRLQELEDQVPPVTFKFGNSYLPFPNACYPSPLAPLSNPVDLDYISFTPHDPVSS